MVLVAAIINLCYSLLYAALAYLLPGYATAKALNSANPSRLADWSQYWVVFALFFCSQWMLDFALCWLPLYYPAKLGFIAALWLPQTQLAQPLYRGVQALLASHEAELDRACHELQARLADSIAHQANSWNVRARVLGAWTGSIINTVVSRAADKGRNAKAKTAAHPTMGQQPGSYRGQQFDQAPAGHGLHTE